MSHIVEDLNPAQQEAVTWNPGPLLILAGAGSGKTRVLTHRAAWLIREKNVLPENMLLLTFTNKASQEMKERIKKLLITNHQSPITSPWAGTFHAFCARVLRKDGTNIGIPPSFTIFDSDDSREAIKGIIRDLNLPSMLKPSAVASVISAVKNELITPQDYQDLAYGDWQHNVSLVYSAYQQLLEETSSVDFDDLLIKVVILFREHPTILEKYQNYYTNVLVDEWQDTNRAQYELTKLLSQYHQNLTVVGDAAQSIYSWRGADYRNLESLTRDFPDIKIINLEQNYRSTETILDAAYSVISKNRTHPILKLWTSNGQGEKITLYQSRNEMDEAVFVVNEINRLIANHLSYRDFAVLYRTNAQSRVLEEALLHSGIPYILVGGVRFYERREVKDVLAFLRALSNEKDALSRKRIEKLGKTRTRKFEEFKNKKGSSEQFTTLELLDEVLAATGYLSLFDPDDTEDAARLENIKELRSVAAEYPNLTEFLEQVALVETAQNDKGKLAKDNSSPAVTLMTAHSAKGLEFQVVFIVGLEEGLFPHARSVNEEEKLEEERRLFYVGITRAKQKLYLTFCSKRLLFGQRSSNLPSQFLMDIPQELLDNSLSITFSPQKLSWLNPNSFEE